MGGSSAQVPNSGGQKDSSESIFLHESPNYSVFYENTRAETYYLLQPTATRGRLHHSGEVVKEKSPWPVLE